MQEKRKEKSFAELREEMTLFFFDEHQGRADFLCLGDKEPETPRLFTTSGQVVSDVAKDAVTKSVDDLRRVLLMHFVAPKRRDQQEVNMLFLEMKEISATLTILKDGERRQYLQVIHLLNRFNFGAHGFYRGALLIMGHRYRLKDAVLILQESIPVWMWALYRMYDAD